MKEPQNPKNAGENPELKLIDLIADHIRDDEQLIDGLGDGTLGMEDVERWYRRRLETTPRVLEECGRLILSMRALGFTRMMRHAPKRNRRVRGQAYWGPPPT